LGKAFTFFAFCWLIVTLAGSVVQGSVQYAATYLTADLTADATTIFVNDTTGFPEPGIIVIDDERIAYSDIDATADTFGQKITQPMTRGAQDTDASAHSEGARVRTVEGSMLNSSMTYNIATIADASGLWAAVTIGLALLRLVGSFLILPTKFLGTDLMLIGVLWYVLAAGMLVSLGLALAGGRRV